MGFFDAFNNSLSQDNHSSPFGEAGLLGDPLHYIVGDKYDNFMRKTWEMPNQYAGQYLTKFDKFDRKINPIHRAIDRTAIGGKIADYAHNKPGDSALAVLGSIFGGGALLGGMGGGGAAGGGGGLIGGGSASGGAAGGGAEAGMGFGGAGTANGGMGIFANGSAQGMGAVGGGNAGSLAASNGILGGAGMGSAGSAAGAGQVSLSSSPQDYMKLAQGMGGQQQQPQSAAAAPPVQNRQDLLAAQIARSQRAQFLRRKLHRTRDENEELRALTSQNTAGSTGLLG